MSNKIINFFLSLSLGLGILSLLSPLALRWWIVGDYGRYLWNISGPYPFSHFGSGPFQMMMYIGLFLLGAALIGVNLLGIKLLNRSQDRNLIN